MTLFNSMHQKPLAERMRPRSLDEYIGQEQIVGPKTTLRNAMQHDSLPSMIFWGPPGSGKTSLARVIAEMTQSHFESLSAVSSGVKDVRRIVEEAATRYGQEGNSTILFLDEVHRFNKSQQDAFLPYVENGTIKLIGATTENPSFEVNSALLSRCQVFVLEQLTEAHIEQIVLQSLEDEQRGYGYKHLNIKKDALQFLAELSQGDARSALNIIEVIVESDLGPKQKTITKKHIEEASHKRYITYDKKGDAHYNTISAFIKSMRAGAVDAAVYYLARMIEAGEDPKFIARRMVIFASEDIGMAQPTALVVANEVFRTCETIGYPECAINLAHGVVYLASAKKDRRAYNALRAAQQDIKQFGNLPVPKKILNAPTQLMRDLDYGKEYTQYDQDFASYLPQKLKGRKYYKDRV